MKKKILTTIALIAFTSAAFAASVQASTCCCGDSCEKATCTCCCDCGQ